MGDGDETDKKASPLVEVNIGNTNLDLRGLERLEGVLNNITKTIASGFSRAYGPLDRVLTAKADRKILNERAQTIIDLTKKSVELAAIRKLMIDSDSPADRAMADLLGEAIPKLRNKERMLEAIAVEVRQEPPTADTSEQIDDDWLADFWSRAELISNKQVQGFLARLLVKEAYQPGSISPLTIDAITKLSPQAARIFEHFCRLSIRWNTDVFVIHPAVFHFQNIGPLDQFGVSFDDLYELEAYGLIRSAETIMYNYAEAPDAPPDTIDYAGCSAQMNFSGLQLQQIRFSRAGREIRQLLPLTPFPEYTEALRSKFPTAFFDKQ